jgi:cell division protein FtsW
MSTASTLIGDRRRAALERAEAIRRHPTRRAVAKPNTPPPAAFYLLAVVITGFVLLGLVMVLSATSILEFHRGNSPFRLFNRQVMWAALGFVGLVVALRVPYHRWRVLVTPALVGACGLMLLPFLPGLGASINGARSWVAVGSFTFQPSEFLKLAVLLYCADLLAKRHADMHDVRRTLLPTFTVGAVAAGLCLGQGDLGSAIVLAAIVFAMVFIAGAPLVPVTGAGIGAGLVGVVFVVSSSRRLARFTAFMDVAAHKDHLSYQTNQAMIAMAQGGIAGEGVGRGTSKLGGYLPLAHSDFIFAVIAEELGFIGVLVVIGGFLAIAYAGIQVAVATPDRFAKLVAGGIVSWLAVQAFINVGGVTGLMPVTGLTLPFFSTGGSSLFVTMVAGGLLLNVARNVR